MGKKWIAAKEYLEKYEQYGRDIKRALNVKKDPHSGISENEVDKVLSDLKEKRRAIIIKIDRAGKIKKIYSKILYKKYIEGKALKEIAGEIDRSYDYVRHKYSEAMRVIEKIINGK